MSLIYRTGFDATCTIGANEFSTVSWSASLPADIQVFKNSKTGNHPQRAATFTDCAGSVVIDWSDTDQPFGAPMTLLPGSSITNIYLYISKASNLFFLISNAIVTGITVGAVRDGKVSATVNWAINGGTITPPGASSGY